MRVAWTWFEYWFDIENICNIQHNQMSRLNLNILIPLKMLTIFFKTFILLTIFCVDWVENGYVT